MQHNIYEYAVIKLFYFLMYMDQAHKRLILANKVVGKTWLNLITAYRLLANVPF